MRKLATVLCLLVLSIGTLSAQSPATDPGATKLGGSTVTYYTVETPIGITPVVSKNGDVTDEVTIWRTSTGQVSQMLVSVSRPAVQAHAAVIQGVATGIIARPTADVVKTKVWFKSSIGDRAVNFEVRWSAAGETTITRLPDDVISGEIK